MLDARSTLPDCGERGQAELPVFYGLLGTGPWQFRLCGFIFMTPKHWDGEEKDGPIFQMFCLPGSKYQDISVQGHNSEPETLEAGKKGRTMRGPGPELDQKARGKRSCAFHRHLLFTRPPAKCFDTYHVSPIYRWGKMRPALCSQVTEHLNSEGVVHIRT